MANCYLCPRHCGANRQAGKLGVCGAPDKIKVALAQLHMWEEPPIAGEHGSGTIFFSHCPLKCVYCQNRAISSGGKGNTISIEEMQQMMLDLQEQGAENINFVTGTQWAPQIVEAVFGIRDLLHIPIVWNTSSYETPETIQLLNEIVDVYLADFKYYSNTLAKQFSNVPNYLQIATAAINAILSENCQDSQSERMELSEHFQNVQSERRDLHQSGTSCEAIPQRDSGLNKKVIIRHLVLPGHTDDSKKVIKHVNDCFGDKVILSIMNQYTPVITDEEVLNKYPELGRSLTNEEYEEVLDFADAVGIDDYFWQSGETCKESFIPNF